MEKAKPIDRRTLSRYYYENADERHAMIREAVKDMNSKEKAISFLKRAGILDGEGELAEHYRSENYGK